MHNIYKFACITLGFGLIPACDHEDTTPRSGDVDPIVCGGFLGLECPDDLACVDDPADDCDPSNGGADCNGICQDPNPTSCGGYGGIDCPEGEVCVDDPADDCDPNNGGADCIGICEPAPGGDDKSKTKPDKIKCNDKDRDYVSKDPAQCAAILFFCPEGQSVFFDECGCGCEPA